MTPSLNLKDLIDAIEQGVQPVDGHPDPGSISDCFDELREKVEAITNIYMTGPWYANVRDVPMDKQVELWTDFRGALGLSPGTATKAGVGHIGGR